MAKRSKYKDGMVIHPSAGERVADVIILIILGLCMFAALIPMWHTLMASLSEGNLLIANEGVAWKWITQEGGPNIQGYLKTLNYNNYAIIKSYGITLIYVRLCLA